MTNRLPALSHKSALVACSAAKAVSLSEGLAALGANVTVLPVISLRGISDPSALDAALDALERYSWIIFTSAYGVRFFLQRLRERNIEMEKCGQSRICAVGPATAEALETAGLTVSLLPGEFMAEGILTALAELYGGLDGIAGRRILLPRAREARDVLPDTLKAAGAQVDVVPCYENTLPEIDSRQIDTLTSRRHDLIVFTSSSTVTNFVALLGKERARRILEAGAVAVLGPITAGTVASMGRKADIVPRASTIPDLLAAVREFFDQAPGRNPTAP